MPGLGRCGLGRVVVTVRTSPAPATHHRYHHHRAEGRGSIFPAAVTQLHCPLIIITIITLTPAVSTLLVVTWW